MNLHRLRIEGLRRIKDAELFFGDATFLIGANNAGKSSVLRAIDHLLSVNKVLPSTEYYSERDFETGETKPICNTIVLEAEFWNIPEEANEWRGFKGRIFKYDVPPGSDGSGLSITYRKTYVLGKDVVVELKSQKRSIKVEYEKCKTPKDYINAGIDEDVIKSLFSDIDKTIPKSDVAKLQALDEIWNISDEEEWFPNPGGIPGNVLSRLPKFLLIPADPSAHEIEDTKKGVLGKTLGELFEDVRNGSKNYVEAQKHLNELAKELDPNDAASEFGKMMKELNQVLCAVFPETQIHAVADLSNPDKALLPSFDVQMSSNVRTKVDQQGTGMVRAAVFGLLRYRQAWINRKQNTETRSLIIGFEEPEIYLHPSAANQMRDTIYQLSSGTSQIVATTHSPYLIDISRKPRQVLNRFRITESHSEVFSFSVTDEYLKLQDDDKQHVKMLLRIDDYVSRAFFTKKVVIVEGDTEDVAIREAIARLPDELRLKIRRDFEVIKARGKASIIGLVKYLNSLGVSLHVIHDRDAETPKAAVFNEPIRHAVGNDDNLTVLDNCVEDVLGYQSPNSEKPFKAYQATQQWGSAWLDVPEAFRNVLARAFAPHL